MFALARAFSSGRVVQAGFASSTRAALTTGKMQTASLSSAESAAEIEVSQSGGLYKATLNRPRALNALTLNMVKQLQTIVEHCNEDDSVNVMCMRGSGEKAFCAGGDVVLIAKSAKGDLGDDGRTAREFFYEEYVADYMLATQKKPYVAILDGITMGGGVGVSVHGLHRVATEKTLFAMPETAIGFFPDVGGGYFLPRLEGGLGWYLALTGARLKGQDLVAAGIATHYVTTDKLDDLEAALSSAVSADDVVQTLNNFNSFDASFEPSYHQHMDQINRAFHPDNVSSVKDVYAALRADGSDWAIKQMSTMDQMSPTSMAISFEQLKRGAKMSLAETLNMEYTIALNCIADHDFIAGVGGKLMKGPEPEWKPASVEDVSEEYVNSFFKASEFTLNIKEEQQK